MAQPNNSHFEGSAREERDANSPDHPVAQLRAILRRYPYWRRGHNYLAEQSLANGDVATAYASAHCVRALSGNSPTQQVAWQHLLGRCFLRRGDGGAALPHLVAARELAPTHYRILEDEAAALMLLGENDRAAEALRAIPTTHLSPEGRITLSFLTNKRS